PMDKSTPPTANPTVDTAATDPMGQAHSDEPEIITTPTPAVDMTPRTFHAPQVQAWMHVGPEVAQSAPARRVGLMDVPQPVGDRRVHFIMIGDTSVDLVGLPGPKLRIPLMPAGPTGRVVHVKGLTCFVALLGGRPSPAVNVDRSSDIALVTPRAQEIGH